MKSEQSTDESGRYAWRELPRVDPPKRSATDRVADFLEVYSDLDEETAREQAARCIQCPNPACVVGCPMANRIPEWLALTAEGHFLEAAELVLIGSSMPEIFSRICVQERQCEANCVLEGPSEPVAIGAVEKFLQEYALREGIYATPPYPPNGFKVAVVGSGPGGLVCAEDLMRLGYAVTVFEASSVPGGLLMRGMPAFKLAKSVVERRIELMRKRGVHFRLGVKVCEDITLDELLSEFDAVYLGIGARQARTLDVPGADLDGVCQGVPFIVQFSSLQAGEEPAVDPRGKRVVVLGGGDTAMDCLRTAIRGGAKEAMAIYRRDENSMPATRKHHRNAIEEGARFLFQALPVALLGNEEGRVTHVRCVRTTMEAVKGRDRLEAKVIPGSEFDVPADLVLVAYGFDRSRCSHETDCAKLTRNAEGDLVVDEHGMTSQPGIFAGGDLVHGPGRLVDTVRDARRGAKAIHIYLAANSSREAGKTAARV